MAGLFFDEQLPGSASSPSGPMCVSSIYLYYNSPMKSNVQARLDRKTQVALEGLMRRFGWTASQTVREGLRLLAACNGTGKKRKIIGAGSVNSGIPDLGSNKKHLEGFGR